MGHTGKDTAAQSLYRSQRLRLKRKTLTCCNLCTPHNSNNHHKKTKIRHRDHNKNFVKTTQVQHKNVRKSKRSIKVLKSDFCCNFCTPDVTPVPKKPCRQHNKENSDDEMNDDYCCSICTPDSMKNLDCYKDYNRDLSAVNVDSKKSRRKTSKILKIEKLQNLKRKILRNEQDGIQVCKLLV